MAKHSFKFKYITTVDGNIHRIYADISKKLYVTAIYLNLPFYVVRENYSTIKIFDKVISLNQMFYV